MNPKLTQLLRHRVTPWVLAGALGLTAVALAVRAQAQGSAPPAKAGESVAGSAKAGEATAGSAKTGDAAAAPAKPALTVQAVTPQTTALTLNLAANGSIAAWQEASVGSETNGWRLAEVKVNVGDRVQRGQVLATFASEMAQAELAQSKAAVAEAEAALAEAAANAQRARDLQASGALSAERINALLTAERTAQARLEAQRATAKMTQIRLAQTQVLAPDSGVISMRSATVGAVVPAGQELFRLIRGGRLEWRAEVAASDLGRIQPGQAVTLVPSGGSAVAGRVRMVAPTVDAATRNGLVYVDLPQPGAAKAGMFARGEFAVGQGQGLTLPQTALVLRDGFAYAFLIERDNRVRQAKVTTGRRVGDRVEIVAGLAADARVVASGVGFLADGDLVRVVGAAPGSGASTPAAAAAKPVAKS